MNSGSHPIWDFIMFCIIVVTGLTEDVPDMPATGDYNWELHRVGGRGYITPQ